MEASIQRTCFICWLLFPCKCIFNGWISVLICFNLFQFRIPNLFSQSLTYGNQACIDSISIFFLLAIVVEVINLYTVDVIDNS